MIFYFSKNELLKWLKNAAEYGAKIVYFLQKPLIIGNRTKTVVKIDPDDLLFQKSFRKSANGGPLN